MNGRNVRNRRWRGLLVVTLMLSMLLGMMQTVQANTYDPSAQGSIHVTLPDLSTSREDVPLSLYKVGTVDDSRGYLQYELVSELEFTGIDLNELTTAELARTATETLSVAVLSSGITPVNLTTDSNGEVTFTGLDQGTYLVTQNGSNIYGTISPSLVNIPNLEEGSTWVYDLEIEAKASSNPTRQGTILVTKKASLFDFETGTMYELNIIDHTYYVGLFYDAAGTIPYGTNHVKAIHISNSTSGSVAYTGLSYGTYYVLETDENGQPVQWDTWATDESGDDWMAIVGDGLETDTNVVELDLEEVSTGEVVVNNVYRETPDFTNLVAELQVTKNVLVNDEEGTVDDTFYVGVYKMVDGERADEPYVVRELTQNGKITIDKLPIDGNGTDATSYMVLETDEDGNPVSEDDSFAYEVTDGDTVAFDRDNNTASAEITNAIEVTPTETPTGTATPTATPTATTTTRVTTTPTARTTVTTTSTTNTTSSVKTGDDTRIVVWLVLLAVAAVAIGSVVVVRRKKRK